jgi:hypothetical protein
MLAEPIAVTATVVESDLKTMEKSVAGVAVALKKHTVGGLVAHFVPFHPLRVPGSGVLTLVCC